MDRTRSQCSKNTHPVQTHIVLESTDKQTLPAHALKHTNKHSQPEFKMDAIYFLNSCSGLILKDSSVHIILKGKKVIMKRLSFSADINSSYFFFSHFRMETLLINSTWRKSNPVLCCYSKLKLEICANTKFLCQYRELIIQNDITCRYR